MINGCKWTTAPAGRVTCVRTCGGTLPRLLRRPERGRGHWHLMERVALAVRAFLRGACAALCFGFVCLITLCVVKRSFIRGAQRYSPPLQIACDRLRFLGALPRGLCRGASPRGFAPGSCIGVLPRDSASGFCPWALPRGSGLGALPRGHALGSCFGVLPRGSSSRFSHGSWRRAQHCVLPVVSVRVRV